jgi:hypothetical protein
MSSGKNFSAACRSGHRAPAAAAPATATPTTPAAAAAAPAAAAPDAAALAASAEGEGDWLEEMAGEFAEAKE